MVRLLLAGLFAYTAYRVAVRIIDEVPGNVAPLDMPGDERRRLRRQSAAMGGGTEAVAPFPSPPRM